MIKEGIKRMFATLAPPIPLNAILQQPKAEGRPKIQSDYAENDASAPSYILNRPFYDERSAQPLTVTWDGVIGDKPAHDISGSGQQIFVKLSDTVFTYEQLAEGSITISTIDQHICLPMIGFIVEGRALGIDIESTICLIDDMPVFAVCYESGDFGGLDVTAGSYSLCMQENGVSMLYTSRVGIPTTSGDTKKLDDKFIDTSWLAKSEITGKQHLFTAFVDSDLASSEIESFPESSNVFTVIINGEEFEFGEYEWEFVTDPNFGSAVTIQYRDYFSIVLLLDYNVVLIQTDEEHRGFITLIAKTEKHNDLPGKYISDTTIFNLQKGLSIIADSSFNDELFEKSKEALKLGKFVELSDYTLISAATHDFDGHIYNTAVTMSNSGIFRLDNYSGNYETTRILDLPGAYEMDNPDGKRANDILIFDGKKYTTRRLNDTLTEDSKLPAMESAVYNAVNALQTQFDEFQSRITAATESLENTLNGGEL